MEEARKRLRVCLIFIVALAVVVGCIYYFGDAGKTEDISEGTLVKNEVINEEIFIKNEDISEELFQRIQGECRVADYGGK